MALASFASILFAVFIPSLSLTILVWRAGRR
jgi:hypothetical protein